MSRSGYLKKYFNATSGHGPFSHVFDNEFLPRARPGIKWNHEQGSQEMLVDLVDKYAIDIDGDSLKFVLELIDGDAASVNREKGIKECVKKQIGFAFFVMLSDRLLV